MAWLLWVGLVCSAGYALFLMVLARGFGRLSVQSGGTDPAAEQVPVTVVIPARNEEEGIAACLQAVLTSSWSNLEVIVVDDHSSDSTPHIVEEVAARYPAGQVRLLSRTAVEERGHKKHALTAGIQASSGEIILQTDADCLPGPDWVPSMVGAFSDRTGLVAGPIAFAPDAGFFRGFQALEILGFVGIAAGGIGIGRPILANAANLGYRKSVFLEVDGFAGFEDLSSGDDELLLYKVDQSPNWEVGYCMSNAALVETRPQTTLRGFVEQRRRWASKSFHYPNRSKTLIGLMTFVAFAFYLLSPVAGVLEPRLWWMVALGWGIKVMGEYTMLSLATRHFHRRYLLPWMFPGQFFQVGYILVAAILGVLGGFTWKGRALTR